MEAKKAAACSDCICNPFYGIYRKTKTKAERLFERKQAGRRRGLDPVFAVLIDHAESQRTARGIDEAFLTLMRALDADHISIDCDKANLTFRIAVTSGTRRYTATTDWDDDETTIRAYDATYGDSGLLEGLDLTDSYSTKRGTLVANGHSVGRG